MITVEEAECVATSPDFDDEPFEELTSDEEPGEEGAELPLNDEESGNVELP